MDACTSNGIGPPTDNLAEAMAAFVAETVERQQHIFLTSPPGIGKTTMVQKLLAMLAEEEGEGAESAVNVVGFYTEEVREGAGRVGFDIVRVGGPPAEAPERFALARFGAEQPKVGKYTVDIPSFEALALPSLEPTAGKKPEPEYVVEVSAFEEMSLAICDLDKEMECTQGSATAEVPVRESVGETNAGSDDGLVEKSETSDPTNGVAECEGHASETAVAKVVTAPQAHDLRPKLCVCDEIGKMELLSIRFAPTLFAALDSGCVMLGTLPQPAKGQRDHEVVEKVRRRPDAHVVRVTRNNRDTLVEEVYAMLKKRLGLGVRGTGKALLAKKDVTDAAEAKKNAPQVQCGVLAETQKLAAKDRRRARQAEVAREEAAKKARLSESGGRAALNLDRIAERKRRREASTLKLSMEIEDDVEAVVSKVDTVEATSKVVSVDVDAVLDVDEAVDVEGLAAVTRCPSSKVVSSSVGVPMRLSGSKTPVAKAAVFVDEVL
mmetsp:Transcript_44149/g.116865  ORF Transcript_44149/g.116865 Transcript_44149/m.116865 type:complete len:493 (-) Transcript_44149:16-1494(-)